MIGLFSPLQIKNFTLNNRIVLPPMANNMSDEDGTTTDKHIEHYVRRAKAGVGMVIVEHAYVQRMGRVNKAQMGIHRDSLVPGLADLAEAVKATGAVTGIQITHGGGKATYESAGTPTYAPTAGQFPGSPKVDARRLSLDDMAGIKAAFVAGAQRAVQAGFDFVEIHGAHGYLLNQFLSPLANRRNDGYGGDLESRLRFPLEITSLVRSVIGDDMLLLYRLSANDFMPGGITTEEGIEAAKALVAEGVDLLDISGGLAGAQTPDWDKRSQGYFVPMAAAIKEAVDVPVVVAGGITDPVVADGYVRDGLVDLIAIGRAMLSDADWASNARDVLGA